MSAQVKEVTLARVKEIRKINKKIKKAVPEEKKAIVEVKKAGT